MKTIWSGNVEPTAQSGYLPRKPVSKATEKQELSALKEAERAKGPEDESRMGLVFISTQQKKSFRCVKDVFVDGCRLQNYLQLGWDVDTSLANGAKNVVTANRVILLPC